MINVLNYDNTVKEIESGSSQMDFAPLFQCIHIHDILNKRIQLKLEFDECRRVIFTFIRFKLKLFSIKI